MILAKLLAYANALLWAWATIAAFLSPGPDLLLVGTQFLASGAVGLAFSMSRSAKRREDGREIYL